jgi:hypothetical protein
MWGCLPTYDLKQIAQQVIAKIEGVRWITHRIEVQTTLGCDDRWNSPGVSIVQDRANLGVKPSLEQEVVAV